MGAKIDLTGQRFGRLTAIKQIDKTDKSGSFYWRCQCDCGRIVDISSRSLRSGHTLSCGCLQREKVSASNSKNIRNRRFGKLVAIKPTKEKNISDSIIWECICDCGNTTYVAASALLTGNTKSCGCYFHDTVSAHLEGKKFNKLLVLQTAPKEKQKKNKVVWECQCDCGNFAYVDSSSLLSGETKSCGCLRSKGEEKISALLKENNINFTKEKTFPDCRFPDTGGVPRFDFWVDDKYLIEFDGEQHNKPNGGYYQDRFDIIRRRDEYKNKYCEEHNIPLIRIPYSKYETLTIEDLLLKEGVNI